MAGGPTPAQVKELREAHPGVNLYQSAIALPKDGGDVVIVWREPRHTDFEMFTSSGSARREAWQAYRNLLASLVVWPSSKEAVAQLRDWPSAIAAWADEHVTPFFGVGAQIETTPL